MTNLKEVMNRMHVIASIQQITKAMKMIAATKLHKAQQMLRSFKEYSHQYEVILKMVLHNIDRKDMVHPFMEAKHRCSPRLLFIVMTSNRGLCGSCNKNLLKTAYQYIKSVKQDVPIKVLVIGKKAYQFFKKANLPIVEDHVNLLVKDHYKAIVTGGTKLAYDCIEHFQCNRFTEIFLVYNAFKNVVSQEPIIVPFLPFIPAQEATSLPTDHLNYIYEPSRKLLLEQLIPEILQNKIIHMLMQATASEHAARMITMGQATDNADVLLKTLRITYNRTRQALITNSITEITSGAEALAEG